MMIEFITYDTELCPYCNQELQEKRMCEEVWKECINCNKRFEIAIFHGIEPIHNIIK